MKMPEAISLYMEQMGKLAGTLNHFLIKPESSLGGKVPMVDPLLKDTFFCNRYFLFLKPKFEIDLLWAFYQLLPKTLIVWTVALQFHLQVVPIFMLYQ